MKLEKVKKLVANLHNSAYIMLIRNLKQALNQGLSFKKVYRVIKFNRKAWLKRYIDMNTKLRQKRKKLFEKDFFKLINNAVFGKNMGNIELVIIELAEIIYYQNQITMTLSFHNMPNYQPNYHYHVSKFFTEILLAIETRKTQILMNNPVYLGLSILDLSKTVMY